MPQVDLTYEEMTYLIEYLGASASPNAPVQQIVLKLSQARGPRSDPESPGDPKAAAAKWQDTHVSRR